MVLAMQWRMFSFQAYLAKMRENCPKDYDDDTEQRSKRSTTQSIWMDAFSNFISTSPDNIPTLSYSDRWDSTYEDGPSFGPISAEGYQSLVDFNQATPDEEQWHGSVGSVKLGADNEGPKTDHGTFHQTTAKVTTRLQAMCGNLSTR
jgi:hypothetical protein